MFSLSENIDPEQYLKVSLGRKEIPDNPLLDRVIPRECFGSFLLQTMEQIPQRSKIEIWIVTKLSSSYHVTLFPTHAPLHFNAFSYFANANATHQVLKNRQRKLE